ncbi:MAG: Co2+/Mg2+ efflux protein ApaG [Lentisphaeria bacterium]|nr:Co2+/Mg2+ efflux protein ApaG [Candidatus Neomarinimicrobiota bacterium]MCF7841420.1 Co2+/Mg2+ efflux protein ApaG [Lentisphaeria bacterium]
MPIQITSGIKVEVESRYLASHSRPLEQYFIFPYYIRISNDSDRPAKLISRHWLITDGFGTVREVEGDGVVGEQPYLLPGEQFEYTSWSSLVTPTGKMSGTFQMIDDLAQFFKVAIPSFTLVVPDLLN